MDTIIVNAVLAIITLVILGVVVNAIGEHFCK